MVFKLRKNIRQTRRKTETTEIQYFQPYKKHIKTEQHKNYAIKSCISIMTNINKCMISTINNDTNNDTNSDANNNVSLNNNDDNHNNDDHTANFQTRNL